MPITVHIPGPLRTYTGGKTSVILESSPPTLAAALAEVGSRFPGVRDRVLDEQGHVRPHVNIFVDKEDVRRADGLATPLKPSAVVHILPAVSGG